MEENKQTNIVVTGSPHVRNSLTTSEVMWNVVLALIPAFAVGIYVFGLDAMWVTLFSIIGCLFAEAFCSVVFYRRKPTLCDGSGLLTGLLLGLTLPSGLPLWIPFVGGVFAVGVGKMAFGGIGQNTFNPALVGRVFLLISFPAAMTTWAAPTHVDGFTGATMLGMLSEGTGDATAFNLQEYFFGMRAGSLGEVGALALIVGGAYLWLRKIITLWIPVSIVAAVVVLDVCTGNNILIDVFSGGLLLGAIFMATDYVTSPMTVKGQVIYGVLIGVITFVIRHYGAYPEGISFAILIMNGCSPLINRWIKPRLFGERKVAA